MKLLWSQLDQQVAITTSEILGPYVQLTSGDAAPFSQHYLRVRGRTIEAGTSEMGLSECSEESPQWWM